MITITCILVGIFISIVIGTLWHMPQSPFGKIHMEYLGFDKLTKQEQAQKIEEAKPHMWKIYLSQSILSAMNSYVLYFIYSKINSVNDTAYVLLIVWLGFVIPLIGSNLLWGPCEDNKLRVKKFVSDALYNLVTYTSIILAFSIIL